MLHCESNACISAFFTTCLANTLVYSLMTIQLHGELQNPHPGGCYNGCTGQIGVTSIGELLVIITNSVGFVRKSVALRKLLAHNIGTNKQKQPAASSSKTSQQKSSSIPYTQRCKTCALSLSKLCMASFGHYHSVRLDPQAVSVTAASRSLEPSSRKSPFSGDPAFRLSILNLFLFRQKTLSA